MTTLAAVLAVGLVVTIGAYAWLLSRYKAATSRKRTLTTTMASGAVQPGMQVQLSQERYYVMSTTSTTMVMRPWRWTDSVRSWVRRHVPRLVRR